MISIMLSFHLKLDLFVYILSPENTPRITRVLFAAPRNEVVANMFLLALHTLLFGKAKDNTANALQKMARAKIGWYWAWVS